MHFLCRCGYDIHDTSDNLSYKGTIIADQDIDTLWSIIEKLEQPHDNKIDVFEQVSDLLRKTIYQCPECGRVYIEDQAHDYKLVGFNFDSDEQHDQHRSLLMSSYGEKWKGSLFAEWRDDKPDWLEYHGIIMPEVNIQLDDLCFDDFDAFERRFYEVLDYLKKLDIIGCASLRVNGKQTFIWPDKNE